MTIKVWGAIATAVLLTACGGSPDITTASKINAVFTVELPTDKYSMANGCYGLKAVASGHFVSDDGNNSFALNSDDADGAEAFFMKPAALGQQIFYASNNRVVSVDGSNVIATEAITEDAIWHVGYDESRQAFSFSAENSGEFMIVNEAGQLALGEANNNNLFQFSLTEKGCDPFPEMPLAMLGDTYKGQGVDKPVIGFADVHAHITASHELSLDGSRGPSTAGAFYGQAVNRLGVTHAMGDCAEYHGPDGTRDGNNVIHANPGGTHVTAGWPTFADWPAGDQFTHQSSYYRWIERAYVSGLRLMVNYGTNMKSLCDVAAAYSGNTDVDCNDHSITMKQVAYTHDIENYIDAQHGGPSKGWFRIVYSPTQAREVINEGKLAVVLGLEASQLFDCGVSVTAAGETPNCTEESFEQKLNDAYDAGIRQLVPLHNLDNAFSGGSIFSGQTYDQSGDTINLLNYLDTDSFYRTSECPDGGLVDYFVPGGAELSGVPVGGGDPISDAVAGSFQGTAPVYEQGVRHCNARGLNDLGRHAFRTFFEKGMVVSIDHAPLLVKRTLLEFAKAQTPPYPMVSGHGYQGGVRNDDVKDLYKAGGYSYPYKWHGTDFVDIINRSKIQYDRAAAEDPSNLLPFAMGFGYDVNGFGGYNPPRRDPVALVEYPFEMFSGPGWGPQFEAANIQAITVDKLSIPNGRTWDTEIDGNAHYGMLPDFVEEVRIEGGEDAITALYNSAESYLLLWERVYKGDD